MRLSIPNPKKYTVLSGNFVFDLRDVFQERNPGVKRDLPATNPKEHSPYSEANSPPVASTHASLAAV
jgi:hypothetical protein